MNCPAPAAKDFASTQEVRWCPGCGDYAVLKAVRETLAEAGAKPHTTAFVSGIGCAARLPYYMATYGFHTIHGRAPAVATGLKTMRPELDVWVVTGDGDGMSIGAGHLFHVLRRNVDLQILLFNNRIYGLTKGQSSPTSPRGLRTPSTPHGSTDNPADPCRFALGAGARFVARAIDVQQPRLRTVLKAARDFRGAALVEILQNCPIYNPGAFDALSDRAAAADNVLFVEHGKPLVFGRDADRGLRLAPGSLRPEVAAIDPGDPQGTRGLLVHDETDPQLGALLAALAGPEFPVALGILHRAPAPPYRTAQGRTDPRTAADADPVGTVSRMIRSGRTWRVE